MLSRRTAIAALLAAPQNAPTVARLESIAKNAQGRLGCAILDTATGKRIGFGADDRFPMCSTFKFLAAAFVLSRVDRAQEQLARRITFSTGDLIAYSPATQPRANGAGMTVAELCEAAVTLSDNTAANLLLASFGGPPKLTEFLRSLGDTVTRLDRNEPDLNEATPGDPRDTTTPAAMVNNLQKLLLQNALSKASQAMLTQWLIGNKTGDARLRAGLPNTWRVGDKTGTGDTTANDIAILWPPARPPILVAAYLTEAKGSPEQRNGVLAQIARAIAS